QMSELLKEGDYLAVVDCTHPYATEVSANIVKSVAGTNVPYYRVTRKTQEPAQLLEGCMFYDSASDCANHLCDEEGTILLTTGSKELEAFCRDEGLRRRLVVRVLPGRESMELCWKQGLEGKQIIAMQGPFTKEMNLATIRQYHVTSLVTKESGKTGGADEKLEAAKEAGIRCHVIRRPVTGEEKIYDPEEAGALLIALWKKTEVKVKGTSLDIVLAGIGMGDLSQRTVALEARLKDTDYLFGARRMIEGIRVKKESFPYYLEKDIVPCLNRIQSESEGLQKVTILFSGDSGFYSGAEKLYKALQGLTNSSVSVWPGISSIVALAARFGIAWQDAMILSTHGTSAAQWKTELLFGARRSRKMFLLTSGSEDVNEICNLLKARGYGEAYELILGYQMSYEGERLERSLVQNAKTCDASGLYSVFLVPTERESTENVPRQITPGWSDETFLRDKVPMTKEEVREVSICKLQLTEGAVAYDIGSGTGSIAMEIAALSPKIMVYALECKDEAVELLHKNQQCLGIYNVEILQTMAPDGFDALPAPTHAFIGGSRGRLEDIMIALREKNPHCRVVVNCISLETISEMQTLLKKMPVTDLDVTTVSVSKAKQVGDYHLMQAANPVTIYSFTFA
ncbi:MAG: precorrin-6A reductase, partial [Lachnospiraceae bacterium]|nr:precorrin-6A reductase [Lachnospiraceae bacterium]